VIVIIASEFPILKLLPDGGATSASITLKSSSNSTRLSEFTVTDAHISVPFAEPGVKVSSVESEEKSLSSADADTIAFF
jgi:hypothetical protein